MTTPSNTPKPGDLDPHWIEANVPEGYTVAAVGDIIITQPLFEQIRRHSPELLEILAAADLVVGNFEGSILDLRKFDGYPEAESGFSWLLASPDVALDLKRMGFDGMTRANNHATDWGVRGMQMTDEILGDAGLVIAGTGGSMAGARAGSHVFGVRATASIVSWTTTFERNTPAADPLGQIGARPGASTLVTTPVVQVSAAQWESLRQIRDAQPAESLPQVLIDFDARMGFVTLFGQHYRVRSPADSDGKVTVSYAVDSSDQASVLLNIRQAKQTSDFTFTASHTHEPNNWSSTPPDFLPLLAQKAIDAGADLVCGHGPHQLRGIEIYKGKPVFYSLGNFCFHENARAVMPREEWEKRVWHMLPGVPPVDPSLSTTAEFMEWTRVVGLFPESVWYESVISVSEFGANGRLKCIRLYPIELGHAGRDALRGIPSLANAAKGIEIMERLKALSAPFGTSIEIDLSNGYGFIDALSR